MNLEEKKRSQQKAKDELEQKYAKMRVGSSKHYKKATISVEKLKNQQGEFFPHFMSRIPKGGHKLEAILKLCFDGEYIDEDLVDVLLYKNSVFGVSKKEEDLFYYSVKKSPFSEEDAYLAAKIMKRFMKEKTDYNSLLN